MAAKTAGVTPTRGFRAPMKAGLVVLLALTFGCQESEAGGTAPAAVAQLAPAPIALLPERTLRCVVRRATNVDTSRDQDLSEIQFEGEHRFDFFLPANAPAPPEARDITGDFVAPTSDSRTRILADPDGLAKDSPPIFNRVADHWPDRVELSTEITPTTFFLLVVNPIDVQAGEARLFMTYTNDQMAYDLKRIYMGTCRVQSVPTTSAGMMAPAP